MNQSLKSTIMFNLILAAPLLALNVVLQEIPQHSYFVGLANLKLKVDYLFLGSSRVNAAIRENEFTSIVCDHKGVKHSALNMGQGYSTAVEYLFGFKKVLAANQHALEHSVIFIEAPGGVPNHDMWTDDWMNSHQPGLLADLIPDDELIRYCRTLPVSLGNKTLLVSSHFLYLVAYGQTFRSACIDKAKEVAAFIWPEPKARTTGAIASGGGVRTDSEGVRSVRLMVLADTAKGLENQQSIDWNKTVLKDLVDLLQANGATVVFYNSPVSESAEPVLNTSTRLADAKNFQACCQSWHCLYLDTDKALPDDHFPDLLHMSKSFSSAFTREVAEKYCDSI